MSFMVSPDCVHCKAEGITSTPEHLFHLGWLLSPDGAADLCPTCYKEMRKEMTEVKKSFQTVRHICIGCGEDIIPVQDWKAGETPGSRLHRACSEPRRSRMHATQP